MIDDYTWCCLELFIKMENEIIFEEGYFKFPFKPYRIQEDFMKNLYLAIENEKIGIFESPTGTVSLILKVVYNF